MQVLLVSFAFFFFSLFSEIFHRRLQQDNGAVKVHPYKATTATGNLRAHLLSHHADEWVQECKTLQVNLRGKEGEEALAKTTGVSVEHQGEARVPFTQDNFVNGLVQFIVATDQVFFFLFFPLSFLILFRLSD